jgi:ubiquinone/menaquinone biosynthesis C-methylase UbiE
MAATDRLFAGSIPEIYDRLLVPLIFEAYALDLAERLARTKPKHVLEIAAGTGALTRAIASRLPAHARIVATDLNEPMHGLLRDEPIISRHGKQECSFEEALADAHEIARRNRCQTIYTFDDSTWGNA